MGWGWEVHTEMLTSLRSLQRLMGRRVGWGQVGLLHAAHYKCKVVGVEANAKPLSTSRAKAELQHSRPRHGGHTQFCWLASYRSFGFLRKALLGWRARWGNPPMTQTRLALCFQSQGGSSFGNPEPQSAK